MNHSEIKKHIFQTELGTALGELALQGKPLVRYTYEPGHTCEYAITFYLNYSGGFGYDEVCEKMTCREVCDKFAASYMGGRTQPHKDLSRLTHILLVDDERVVVMQRKDVVEMLDIMRSAALRKIPRSYQELRAEMLAAAEDLSESESE